MVPGWRGGGRAGTLVWSSYLLGGVISAALRSAQMPFSLIMLLVYCEWVPGGFFSRSNGDDSDRGKVARSIIAPSASPVPRC